MLVVDEAHLYRGCRGPKSRCFYGDCVLDSPYHLKIGCKSSAPARTSTSDYAREFPGTSEKSNAIEAELEENLPYVPTALKALEMTLPSPAFHDEFYAATEKAERIWHGGELPCGSVGTSRDDYPVALQRACEYPP